jgi:hypothetical protein
MTVVIDDASLLSSKKIDCSKGFGERSRAKKKRSFAGPLYMRIDK